jgi:hypothetical protein
VFGAGDCAQRSGATLAIKQIVAKMRISAVGFDYCFPCEDMILSWSSRLKAARMLMHRTEQKRRMTKSDFRKADWITVFPANS